MLESLTAFSVNSCACFARSEKFHIVRTVDCLSLLCSVYNVICDAASRVARSDADLGQAATGWGVEW